MASAADRREELKAVYRQAAGCTRCPHLAAARTTVVFGSGNADADLMFVGEAPGANEDRQGLPFVGQAGRLLERLLGEIGLAREDVFIANVLKCRPPDNRDPLPQEIDNCRDYLFRQLELIRPRVVCTLGNFATKLLRGDPATGITRLHGRDEVRVIGPRAVRLYPLYHPAAALYTPRMLETVRADFARIPELLALEPPPQPAAAVVEPVVAGPGALADPAGEEAGAVAGEELTRPGSEESVAVAGEELAPPGSEESVAVPREELAPPGSEESAAVPRKELAPPESEESAAVPGEAPLRRPAEEFVAIAGEGTVLRASEELVAVAAGEEVGPGDVDAGPAAAEDGAGAAREPAQLGLF